MADIYGHSDYQTQTPFTADKAILTWGDVVTGAVQVNVTYAQQANRRRTIGNRAAVIWTTMPSGQINIQRLVTTNTSELFKGDGWTACKPGTITLALTSDCDASGKITFTAKGCVVTQFSISAEAESLTVMDNVVIEFLQLDKA
jgi:hypothetical protein